MSITSNLVLKVSVSNLMTEGIIHRYKWQCRMNAVHEEIRNFLYKNILQSYVDEWYDQDTYDQDTYEQETYEDVVYVCEGCRLSGYVNEYGFCVKCATRREEHEEHYDPFYTCESQYDPYSNSDDEKFGFLNWRNL